MLRRVNLAAALNLWVRSYNVFLPRGAACATDHSPWMDHATLVIRPSQHQAGVAFAFGADPPRKEAGALAKRNIAATIAAAAVVRDNPLPSLDTVDFKGGRLFIHSPREH